MWAWLRRLFARGKFDVHSAKFIKAARAFSEGIEVQVLLQLTRARIQDPQSLSEDKLEFVCGYIAGFSDVISQAYNGQPGGDLSQTVTARVLHDLFGQSRGQELFDFTFECMATDPPRFISGMSSGGHDANDYLGRKRWKGLHVATGLSNYLSQ